MSIIFAHNFDDGDDSFPYAGRVERVAADRIRTVTSPVRQGTRSMRVEVRRGDDPISSSGNRAELSMRQHRELPGSEYWYRWSTYFEPSFPQGGFTLFAQWHQRNGGGSPPVEFRAQQSNTIDLAIRSSGGASPVVLWSRPRNDGTWHDFIFHARWHSDPSVGFVELWYNGAHELARTPIRTMYPGEPDNYLKIGYYRNENISATGVLYHDDWVKATTQEEVFGTAPGTPPPPPTPPPPGDPEPPPTNLPPVDEPPVAGGHPQGNAFRFQVATPRAKRRLYYGRGY